MLRSFFKNFPRVDLKNAGVERKRRFNVASFFNDDADVDVVKSVMSRLVLVTFSFYQEPDTCYNLASATENLNPKMF